MLNSHHIEFVQECISKFTLVHYNGGGQNFTSSDERLHMIYNDMPVIVKTLTGIELDRQGIFVQGIIGQLTNCDTCKDKNKVRQHGFSQTLPLTSPP